MILASVGFGAAILVCAFAPFLGLAYAALLFVGWASVSFIAIGNSTIQLSAEPGMRGRVISLWQVAFQGTTPVGGPAIGWIIALTDPRIGLAVGGAVLLRGRDRRRRPRPALPPDGAAAGDAAGKPRRASLKPALAVLRAERHDRQGRPGPAVQAALAKK